MNLKTIIDALFWMKAVSMVLGIIFNILVIVVRGNKFVRQRRISSYHFIILQIALADLIHACLLSFEVEKYLNNFVWVHSMAVCRIVYALSAMSAGVPILLMLLLAIERYLGVINALTHKLRTRSILLVGIFIWVFLFIVILPILISLKIHDHFGACAEEMDPLLNKVVTIFYFIVFMVIPLLLSTLFHCRIYHFVRRHTKKMLMHVQIKTPPGQLNNNRLDGNTSEASFITKTSSVAGDCNTYLVTEKMQLSNMPSSVGSTRDENEELCPQSKKSHVVLEIGGKTIRKICHSGTTMCYKVRHRLTGIRRQRKEKTRRLKVHILLAITVSFFVVNAPTNIWHTLNLYFKFSLQTRIYMIFVTGLGSMRCFINGIIYSLMDYKFRKEFRLLVKTLIYGRAYEKKYQQKSHSYPSRSTQMHSVSGNQC